MKPRHTLYTPKWYDWPIISRLRVWASLLRVETHRRWSMQNSHLSPSSDGKVRGSMVLEHFYQREGSQQVPDGTRPWSPLFYTLTHWPNSPRQQKICDAKRIYSCLGILGIWLLSGIATKSSDFNLPSKDKKWFQEKPRWWTIEHSVH